MISHELKCIFIHIPRTAGSSIETSLVGQDWWKVEPKTKHLIASQAKKIYSKYWDDYFKFSFVRNPYSRMLSMATFSQMRRIYYGDSSPSFKGVISDKHLNNYKNIFGNPVCIEYDHRFYKREELENEKHKENRIYGNILDEPIDYIGRFETLGEDFKNICSMLGLKEKKLPKIGSNPHAHSLSLDAKLLINEIYAEDFVKFNFNKEKL